MSSSIVRWMLVWLIGSGCSACVSPLRADPSITNKDAAKPPQVVDVDAAAVSRLQRSDAPEKEVLDVLTELEEKGGRTALRFLQESWRPVEKDLRDAGRSTAVALEIRLAPVDEKPSVIERLLRGQDGIGLLPAIDAAGNLGVVSALPHLDRIVKNDDQQPPYPGSVEGRAFLAARKIRLLMKHAPSVAYLMAAQCDGTEDGKFHHPCPLRLWGIKMLGTIKDPEVTRHLVRIMEETSSRARAFKHRLLSARERRPPLSENYYASFYHHAAADALRNRGMAVAPDPHVRSFHDCHIGLRDLPDSGAPRDGATR